MKHPIPMILVLALVVGAIPVRASWWQERPAGEVLAELPMDLVAAEADWVVFDKMAVVRDDVLGRDVIEYNGRRSGWFRTRAALDGPCEIIAAVRIAETKAKNRGAALHYGIRGDGVGKTDYTLHAQSSPGRGRHGMTLVPRMGSDAAWFYRSANTERPWPRSVSLSDRFTDVSPVWDQDFRMEVESAIAGIRPIQDSWFVLRIVQDRAGLRMYKDGFLVAERRQVGAVRGAVAIRMSGRTRVASLVVRRSGDLDPRYYPVDITDLCNAGRFGDADAPVVGADALPAGRDVVVDGVPFAFPGGRGSENHIDVGASLFRYRNYPAGVMARQTWPPSEKLDDGRIMFRAPNRPYERLWVIAASDGDELSVPAVTVRFFRPLAGFSVDAEATVPSLTAKADAGGAVRLPVTLDDGQAASLWLVPIELDSVAIASRFREASLLSVELTKQVHDFRAYPDPMSYGRLQGGLPSAVHILAMTLEEAPLRMLASGTRTGNAYVPPEVPIWEVSVGNLRGRAVDAEIRVEVTDPYGQRAFGTVRDVRVDANATAQVRVPIATSVYGLHDVTTEVALPAAGESDAARIFRQEGKLIWLPDDTRRATVLTSRWGLPNFAGAHLTNPNMEESFYLHRAAGSRMTRHTRSRYQTRRSWGLFPRPIHLFRGPEKWAYDDPYDAEQYEAFSERIGRHVADELKKHPDLQYVTLFAETKISMLYAGGTLPEYLGEPAHVLDEKEEIEFRARRITAEAATKGIRKHAPRVKVLFGWCGSLFSVPFMQRGYPRADMDGIGLDMPQFERMPEMPVRSVTPSRLWMLQEEMRRSGYEDVPLVHCESYFPSSHRLALGHRRAADHIVRTAVLSMAMGSDRFLGCFSLYDCADYWGSQHYGCVGIVGRRPEYDPKPGFAAYATMTRLLDVVEYDGYVPTGSLSAYCVRFKASPYVQCLWTVRGERDAELELGAAGQIAVVDESGNEVRHELVDGKASVRLSPTPVWVTSERPIAAVTLGVPAYTNAPGPAILTLDSLEQPWVYRAEPYERYASNHWDMLRVPGPMVSESVESDERQARVWRVALQQPGKERKFAAWYGVFTPPTPVDIPGKARALGVWVNGKSNWGRIIYEIEDANGETWQSIGTRDAWNCDDIHSWSSFNFDGWRYVEFPLPGNLPWDNYREKDSVWWNNSAEGVVDLPVKLTRIIIEHRTHLVYVNDCLPVSDRSVELHNLSAVYADRASMTDAPVRLQRAAAGRLSFRDEAGRALANPIASLRQEGAGVAPTIARVAPPAVQYDGTRVVVSIAPVAGAAEYRVYVAAYEDGRGAKTMASGSEPELLVRKLRPEVPLYLFVTYLDADKAQSKPSAARRVLLRDEFPMK